VIFKLIKEDGLKYKDVAALLNISVKTVEAQLAIAMKKFAALFIR
jgi:RNA polymerase sigma-70 factor (ECF subfamily)